jgi:hypothetical protein
MPIEDVTGLEGGGRDAELVLSLPEGFENSRMA